MIRSHAALVAIAVLTALAAPAMAEEEDANFDMRASLEYQSWSWVSPVTGTRLDYSTPMTVFTVMDHSGGVFGAVRAVSANETRRRQAEREAIRNDKRTYTYVVEEATPSEGTHLGFSVGVGPIMGNSSSVGTGGAVPNLTGASLSARYAKIHLEGDIVQAGPGVLVFESGVAYWSALALPAGVAETPQATGNLMYIEAWNWPIGLRYRYRPTFVPGLEIMPSFNFDWLYTLYHGVNGNWRFDARNFGLELGYYVNPQLKLRAGYFFNALAHNQVDWMRVEDVVGMRNATLGATLYF